MVCFFFFKQKTAYEMRISDWSSDVCSSDLVQSFTRGGGYNSNYLTLAFLGVENFPLTVAEIPYAEGLKVKYDRLSWKASVSWKPVDSITTYATISTGFRTPVVNARAGLVSAIDERSAEPTSELQSLMRMSYAGFFLNNNNTQPIQ